MFVWVRVYGRGVNVEAPTDSSTWKHGRRNKQKYFLCKTWLVLTIVFGLFVWSGNRDLRAPLLIINTKPSELESWKAQL